MERNNVWNVPLNCKEEKGKKEIKQNHKSLATVKSEVDYEKLIRTLSL